MPAEFLGVGWSFPVEPESGEARMAAYEESIRQSIWIILSTSRGERVMRPDFGCGLQNFVFSPSDASTIGMITYDVHRSLELWESRVEVLSVRVSSAARAEVLEINIEYRVLSTNSRYNLVYPFYLNRMAA